MLILPLKHPVEITLTAPFVGPFLVLSPSSCAVPQQPERPDCELHGDWTGATERGGGGGGAHLLSSGEGDAPEVHDPDEAPPRRRTGTGNTIFHS